MLNLKNRKKLIIVIGVVFVSLFFMLSAPKSVGAVLGDKQTFDDFMRNIVLKSPAGNYYVALLMSNQNDFGRIYFARPDGLEHLEKLKRIIDLFLPGMRAMLDGRGDTVYITQEQMDSVQAEIDWLSSVAEAPLREDIEKEEQRFPLNNFVGMTMNEAFDFVNADWPAELTAESVLPLVSTPLPYATVPAHPMPICKIGNAPDCLHPASLVDDSNGLWAYDIVDNVYFEYPSAWTVNQSPNPEILLLTFIPSSGSFEEATTRGIFLGVQHFIFPGEINYDEIGCTSDGSASQPNVLLHESINLPDFKGHKTLWKEDGSAPTIYIESVVYNADRQLMVCWITAIDNDVTGELLTNPESVDEIFPNIQRTLESIEILDE
ncbi:MAG: hypothetical protein LC108_12130 [Anaerolineales bacterium]|nr:hypothetical protein [Anaerolineales bacterium]